MFKVSFNNNKNTKCWKYSNTCWAGPIDITVSSLKWQHLALTLTPLQLRKENMACRTNSAGLIVCVPDSVNVIDVRSKMSGQTTQPACPRYSPTDRYPHDCNNTKIMTKKGETQTSESLTVFLFIPLTNLHFWGALWPCCPTRSASAQGCWRRTGPGCTGGPAAFQDLFHALASGL